METKKTGLLKWVAITFATALISLTCVSIFLNDGATIDNIEITLIGMFLWGNLLVMDHEVETV